MLDGTHALSWGSTVGALLAMSHVLLPSGSFGDAIPRTQALHASTIAEYFVDQGHVELALEIGMADRDAFRNLLPDAMHQSLGHAREPLASRLKTFFQEDFVLHSDDSRPLQGRLTEIGTRVRPPRESLTGKPIDAARDTPDTVLFVRLEYTTPTQPRTLTLGGSAAGEAAIGFVLYHEGIAVNDLRYLSRAQTVELDWADPWYTQFRHRAYRRANMGSAGGFLYVEPLQVRKEIIFRVKDLNAWVDLGLKGRKTIPVEMQDEIKRRAVEFLGGHQPVQIDGRGFVPEQSRVDFVARTLRSSGTIEPPVELDINGAILRAVFTYPTTERPEMVTMEWDLWNDRIQNVPAAVVDRAGPLPAFLEPASSLLEWEDVLDSPAEPVLISLSLPPSLLTKVLYVLRWPLVAIVLSLLAWTLLGFMRGHRHAWLRVVLIGVTALASIVSFRVGQWELSDDAARQVVRGLLHNVYRAHDFPEAQIHDVMRNHVSEDAIDDVYGRAAESLDAPERGVRATFAEVDLVELDTEFHGDNGFVATAIWNVKGTSGHWGHLHERSRRQQAVLDIRPVGNSWQIAAMTPF